MPTEPTAETCAHGYREGACSHPSCPHAAPETPVPDRSAARTLAQDGPLTETQEAEALHVALRGMSIAHPSYLHPMGQPFRYRPGVCPGCAYSVIREMFRERGVEGG